jgi:Na+-translocating ferredoxin:NAD+ oxidoreductase RnfD subunit
VFAKRAIPDPKTLEKKKDLAEHAKALETLKQELSERDQIIAQQLSDRDQEIAFIQRCANIAIIFSIISWLLLYLFPRFSWSTSCDLLLPGACRAPPQNP